MKVLLTIVTCTILFVERCQCFTPPLVAQRYSSTGIFSTAVDSESKGFAKVKVEKENDVSSLTLTQLKDELLDLLPKMMGRPEEFRRVEALVNAIESKYQPAQTLEFLNLAMHGEWQLLFSTNLSGVRANFRLRELIQRVQCKGLKGMLTNEATWDLAEDGEFDVSGKFSVQCSYIINQGARMEIDLEDHVLQPAKGSRIPEDVQGLVGLLHRAMPKEMFDPSDHSLDTTYLDGHLRIVRYTGPRLEGIRDIFIRRGALEINPQSEG